MIRECIVCGATFKPRGPQKCCSKLCMDKNESNLKKNRRLREYRKRKEERRKNYQYGVCIICGDIFHLHPPNRKACPGKCTEDNRARMNRENAKRYRLSNPEKAAHSKKMSYIRNKSHYAEKNRQWREANRERDRELKLNSYYKNTDTNVRNKLKHQLGFTPPPDLVEEATALLLLRRALKST